MSVFIVAFLVLLPSEAVEDMVAEALKDSAGIEMRTGSFEKRFPASIEMSAVELSTTGRGVRKINLDSVSGNLNILSLILGSPSFALEISKDGGVGTLEAKLSGASTSVDFDFEGIKASGIYELTKAGIGSGRFDGGGEFDFSRTGGVCFDGWLKVKGEDIDIDGLSSSIPSLILGKEVDATSSLTGSECTIEVKTLWIEGKRAIANISGTIELAEPLERSALDLVLELTSRDGAEADGNAALTLLEPFRKTKSYYKAKISGTIERPSVSR